MTFVTIGASRVRIVDLCDVTEKMLNAMSLMWAIMLSLDIINSHSQVSHSVPEGPLIYE